MANLVEECIGIDAFLGIQVIVATPVIVLLAIGGQQRGDGMATGTNQLGQEMLSEPLRGLRG